MVRVHVKGGIWRNTEDEILKAAVMKYGLYQWGRIASLMNRKTAKQCKARWYEWLDPSIKKTEWSREEDEKLLHATKILSCQWRSIAMIVGRTATQCLDRYNKLLNAATNQSTGDEKLLIGQVDMNAEGKPALPDAVDMEEDEKEMLQEARARMANTKGKKAKRIAREKQLEEARRLTILQRKREMKAAGINVNIVKRGKRFRGADFKEIPFFHAPKPGFHDVSSELQRPPSPIDFRTMAQIARDPTRKQEEEERRRKQDILKEKDRIMRAPEVALMELAKEQAAKRAAIRQKSHLNLPQAQITEEEMSQLAKMTYEIGDDSNGPTDDLLPTYPIPQAVGFSKSQKDKAKLGLANLPQPKYTEFSIELNKLEELDTEEKKPDLIVDAGDIEKESQLKLLESAQQLLDSRSSASKRFLYRPKHISDDYIIRKDEKELSLILRLLNEKNSNVDSFVINFDDYKNAKILISQQMVKLVNHDNIMSPHLDSLRMGNVKSEVIKLLRANFDFYSSEEISNAQSLIEEQKNLIETHLGSIDFRVYQSSWTSCHERYLTSQQNKPFIDTTNPNIDKIQIDSIKSEFEIIEKSSNALKKVIDSIEKKLTLYQSGYIKRGLIITEKIIETKKKLINAELQLLGLEKTRSNEILAIRERIKCAKEIHEKVTERASRLFMDN